MHKCTPSITNHCSSIHLPYLHGNICSLFLWPQVLVKDPGIRVKQKTKKLPSSFIRATKLSIEVAFFCLISEKTFTRSIGDKINLVFLAPKIEMISSLVILLAVAVNIRRETCGKLFLSSCHHMLTQWVSSTTKRLSLFLE